MNNATVFSDRLSELMFYSKITSEQLGKILGINGSTIRRWLCDFNSISLSHAIIIAEYFNCSLDFLLGRSDKQLDFIPQKLPSFYEHLRIIMKEKNISRYRICIDLKMSNGNFTQWKRGVLPKMQTLISIADYLDITLDYLIGREN